MAPSNGSTTRERAVIIGGAGYVGLRLGQALADAGHRVLLLDVTPLASTPHSSNSGSSGGSSGGGRVGLGPGLEFAACDVRDQQALTAHFAGASVVFHLASAGMSGAQQLQRRLVESVNVGGTRAVLGAAAAAAVGRLIYLSTYNVVYCGQLIEGGDEALPPCPPDAHCDAYSRTKALAEAAVLAADGTPMPGRPGRRLRTCALRPAGIWGPGEQRHLPRIVRYLEMGLFCFTIGGPDDAVVDWVHVDNLVQAMCLAAAALTPEKRCVAGGQAYFIHDDWPGVTSRVNQFAFLRPLVEGLGYPFPRLQVPAGLMFYVAWLLELLHWLLWPLVDISRWFLLTRAEVLKSGRTHWFSVRKAREELGYAPQRYSFQPVVDWFLERGHGRRGSGKAAAADGEQRRKERRPGGSSAHRARQWSVSGMTQLLCVLAVAVALGGVLLLYVLAET